MQNKNCPQCFDDIKYLSGSGKLLDYLKMNCLTCDKNGMVMASWPWYPAIITAHIRCLL